MRIAQEVQFCNIVVKSAIRSSLKELTQKKKLNSWFSSK